MYEFGSPEWLRAICDLIEKWLADSGVDLTGINWTSGEQFTDVPARLNPTGAPTVGWTLRIRDGVVSTEAVPPPADADADIVADWDSIEPFAHPSDPEQASARAERIAQLTAEGKLRHIDRTERPPALVEAFAGPGFLEAAHAFTAPRQGP